MKNLMWKKIISLGNFRKDQGSAKASLFSNVLTVAMLVILHPSVPISKRTLKMKKIKINQSQKKEKSNYKKKSYKAMM
jgi:hypothetical protein